MNLSSEIWKDVKQSVTLDIDKGLKLSSSHIRPPNHQCSFYTRFTNSVFQTQEFFFNRRLKRNILLLVKGNEL